MTFNPIIPLWFSILFLVLSIVLLVLCFMKRMKKTSDMSLFAFLRRVLVVIIAFIISIGPMIMSNSENRTLSDMSVIFVVDNSGSMSAKTSEDAKNNGDKTDSDATNNSETDNTQKQRKATRLDQVKEDINTILDTIPPSKYSIIEYNSTVNVALPLTSNITTARSYNSQITPELTDLSNGTRLTAPIDTISSQIDNIKQMYPRDRIMLYFFSDGDSSSSPDNEDLNIYSKLHEKVNGGYIIGYGDSEPAEMYKYSPDLSGLKNLYSSLNVEAPKLINYSDSLILDPSTHQPAVSSLNEDNLRKIGDNIGVDVLRRSSSATIKSMSDSIYAKYWIFAPSFEKKITSTLIVWPFYIALSLLVLCEFFMFVSSRLGNVRRLKG